MVKTNRSELDDLQKTKFKIVDVFFIIMRPRKTQSQNLQYNLEQLGKISNFCFWSDDTPLHYIYVLLLTEKLNIKCYVLYKTKELLTTSTMYIQLLLFLFLLSASYLLLSLLPL